MARDRGAGAKEAGAHAGAAKAAVRRPLASRPGSRPASRYDGLGFFESNVTRVASIPIGLWVCAAVVAHLVGGGSAMKAAEVVHDRDELRAAARSVRRALAPADTTFEILTDATEPSPPAKAEPPKQDAPADGAKGEADPDPEAVAEKPKPVPQPKAEERPKPPEPPKVAEKPKPPEPPKPLVPVPVAPVPVPPTPAAPPPPLPEADHRIAVRQHAKKDQPDNTAANRIADDANHVEKETVARNRSHDQDAKDPSFGASAKKPSAEEEPGGGDKETKVAQSEDKKGDEKHAPGEKHEHSHDAHHEVPKPPVPPTVVAKAPPPAVPGGKGGKGAAPAVAAPPPSPGGAGPASPDIGAGEKGGFTLDPANPGGDGKSRIAGKKQPLTPFQSPVHVGSLGLGGAGLPGGPQINLDMKGVEVAVGAEQLRAERAADGAARRSAHRGKWEKNKFQKWKPAIENYEPSVELANTTALNAARSPFATYINGIHNRIHPIFAEEFLAALEGLPRDNPLTRLTNITHLELVLAKDTGRIVRMGVARSSGLTAFDIVALSSVDRAGPFGKAPEIIASPDGNVYLHWEFHRDPFDACSTRNARPFLLKDAPKVKSTLGPRRGKPTLGPRNDERGGQPPGPTIPLGK